MLLQQVTSILFAAVATAPAVLALPGPGPERPHIREFLYTGGVYYDDGTGTGEHVLKDQMYVEHLTPLGGCRKRHPILLMPGLGQTGTNFLNKPDGNAGWASAFLAQGYEVYLIDQPMRGRSPYQPGNGTTASYSAEFSQQRFTAIERYKTWPQAAMHTQWPGTGIKGDPIFDQFYASQIQYITDSDYQQRTVQFAGADLLDRISKHKKLIVLGHSQGGPYPWLIADARPDRIHALIGLEPAGPPFQDAVIGTSAARAWGISDAPMMYDPPVTNPATDLVKVTIPSTQPGWRADCIMQATSPPPRQLPNLKNIPILVVTAEASYHAPYDHCTVNYMRQAGVQNLTHIRLEDINIHGNGHMIFLEKNSDEVQMVLSHWLDSLE